MISTREAIAGSETALHLRDLVRRLAREMRIAASIADDCQDALGDDVRLSLDHETSMRLQGLDLLSQQLVEIGRVLDRVGEAESSSELSSVLLDDVRLSDLKRRLSGTCTDVAIPIESDLW
jgi:hypothetical protein